MAYGAPRPGPNFTEPPPRPSFPVYKRAAIAGALIVALTAVAVATGALLQVKEVVDTIQTYGHVAKLQQGTITKAQAGQPQTILLVGSDRRFGQTNKDARSDTLMLLRLDPNQEATGVLSIPRDLLVTIPGHGENKINSAYSDGGLDLTTRTVKKLLGININHAIEVNFKGFREAVNEVGCVYTDVDRRYYHSNLGLPPSQQYAEINIQPGYQKLCGQKALDYVRFRHADTDLVRAARQQDFVRQAKDQVGSSGIVHELKPLVKIFAKATESDANLQSESGVLRLLKLAIFSSGHPTREVHFPATFVNSPVAPVAPATTNYSTASYGVGVQPQQQPYQQQTPPGGGNAGLGDYVTATQSQIHNAVQQFLHAKRAATSTAKAKTATARSTHKHRGGKSSTASPAAYHLVDARKTGEDLVAKTVAGGKLGFPLYFPMWLTPMGQYPQPAANAPMPYVYSVPDRAGHPHQAYRLVVAENVTEGQYYGIQGTTWKTPPLLEHADDKMRMRGRTYFLQYDGSKLRAVIWKTPQAVYWVSNTLSEKLSSKEMLGIARSLTRFGQGG